MIGHSIKPTNKVTIMATKADQIGGIAAGLHAHSVGATYPAIVVGGIDEQGNSTYKVQYLGYVSRNLSRGRAWAAARLLGAFYRRNTETDSQYIVQILKTIGAETYPNIRGVLLWAGTD